MLNLAVAIPTCNEHVHIRRCVESVSKLDADIFILDSSSSDDTCEIAESMGCVIFHYPRATVFSDKLNQSLGRLCCYDYVLRIDADEVITLELLNAIRSLKHSVPDTFTGYSVDRQLCFMGKPLKWGATVSHPVRLVNPRLIRYQESIIDEHISQTHLVLGRLNGSIYDNPLHGYSHWLKKHIDYSLSETKSVNDRHLFSLKPLSCRIYYRAPILIRPFVLFIYRYFILLGFLDGMPGLGYHLSQTLLYRFVVDIRLSCRLF